jgi:hypothetical protein
VPPPRRHLSGSSLTSLSDNASTFIIYISVPSRRYHILYTFQLVYKFYTIQIDRYLLTVGTWSKGMVQWLHRQQQRWWRRRDLDDFSSKRLWQIATASVHRLCRQEKANFVALLKKEILWVGGMSQNNGILVNWLSEAFRLTFGWPSLDCPVAISAQKKAHLILEN